MLIVPQWVFTLITFNRDVIFSGPFFSMHAVCDALRPMAQLTLSYFLCAGQCSVYVFASWWCFSTKLGETILAYFIFASLLHWKKTKNNKNRWPMWKRLKDYIYIYIFFFARHWALISVVTFTGNVQKAVIFLYEQLFTEHLNTPTLVTRLFDARTHLPVAAM